MLILISNCAKDRGVFKTQSSVCDEAGASYDKSCQLRSQKALFCMFD